MSSNLVQGAVKCRCRQCVSSSCSLDARRGRVADAAGPYGRCWLSRQIHCFGDDCFEPQLALGPNPRSSSPPSSSSSSSSPPFTPQQSPSPSSGKSPCPFSSHRLLSPRCTTSYEPHTQLASQVDLQKSVVSPRPSASYGLPSCASVPVSRRPAPASATVSPLHFLTLVQRVYEQ